MSSCVALIRQIIQLLNIPSFNIYQQPTAYRTLDVLIVGKLPPGLEYDLTPCGWWPSCSQTWIQLPSVISLLRNLAEWTILFFLILCLPVSWQSGSRFFSYTSGSFFSVSFTSYSSSFLPLIYYHSGQCWFTAWETQFTNNKSAQTSLLSFTLNSTKTSPFGCPTSISDLASLKLLL